jgi:O-antigen/teichoic acid export membrane protein
MSLQRGTKAPQGPVEGDLLEERSDEATVEAAGFLRTVKRRFLWDGSLTKKASLNTVATVLDYGARAIVGFVVNPILLTHLGEVGFGDWQVVQRLIGHANPAGGRPSEALKWYVANRKSSADYADKRRAVGSAIGVWLLFTPILALVGGALGWFAPVWLHAPAASYAAIRLCCAVLVADLVVEGLANVPWAVLQGENLGYKRMGLTASFEMVGGALAVLAVVLGGGLVGLALAGVATTVLSGALFIWIVRNYVPWFGIAKPSLRFIGRFMRLSWWFLLWNLVTKITMGADVIVLGFAASSKVVTVYSLTRFVPLTITAGVGAVILSVMPGLGGLVGAGELRRSALVRTETMAASWLIATVAGAGVLLWERSFLGMWVGEKYYPGLGPTFLIVLMVLQLALIRVDSNIIDLTLNLRLKVLLGLLAAGLSVVFAWVLISRFQMGIAGLAVGFIAGRAIQSVTYPVMVGHILRIPTRDQLKGLIRPSLVTGLVFAVCALGSTKIRMTSWIKFIPVAALSGAILLAITFFAGLGARQRERLWARARQVAHLR